MTSSIRQFRDFLLLLLWGGFVLWMAISHQLSTYLHPTLQPYTVAGGVVLIVLALFSLRDLLTQQGKDSACHHDHSCCHSHSHGYQEYADHDGAEGEDEEYLREGYGCDHDHQDHSHHEHGVTACEEEEEHESPIHEPHHHGEASAGLFSLTFKTLLLLLPLSVVLFGRSNHYTMTTVQNRGVVHDLNRLPAAKRSSTPPQSAPVQTADTSSNSMPVQVIDLLYAVQMPTYREEFEGKQVELTGQFVPLATGNPKGDRFQAIRLFITCCAADAKPVGVTVQYDKPLKISEMGWVKITGTPTFPMEGGRRTAVLVANKVEECPAPAEPFVY